jgi:ABC-type transport system involved in cytochrome c biogenesis ATPase subunit
VLDGTFSWILSPRTPFLQWITEIPGVFFIYGKAGSGKSTLMRYIAESPETGELLKVWAGSNHLITAKHFFWSSGTPLQKSHESLLQSLLFQIL